MSYKYLIDSSAWLEYFGGGARGAKLKRIIEEETIATSVFAIAELADKFEREQKSFAKLFAYIQSRAAIIDVTIAIALLAGKLKNDLRKEHEKFGLGDALHLATAAEEDAILVTTDNDFQGVENVMVVA